MQHLLKLWCVVEDAISDQSFRCGQLRTMPCPTLPYCGKNLAVGDGGVCVRCGHRAGALPCTSTPACKGRMTDVVEGVALQTCENCGGEDEPPCSDKLSDPPCDSGLHRTTITSHDKRLIVVGQQSVCASQKSTDQCGFVGQKSCGGTCQGRSVPSEDNLTCIECGSASQVICDGPEQERCDDGLEEYHAVGQRRICLCPEPGCAGPNPCPDDDAIIDQSRPGNGATLEDERECGSLGQSRCLETPYCGDQLLADEDGICHPCGEAEGAVPCADEPQCGYRLSVSLADDFCTACGGPGDPVCCETDFCSEDDPFDTPCDAGLTAIGVRLGTDLELRSQAAEAYCSEEGQSSGCGKVGQPPCVVELDENRDPARPCYGLSTPSADGLECIRCGKADQPPCINRFKMCTGKLVAVFSDDKPDLCIRPAQMPDGAVADQSVVSNACGTAGLPWCKGTPARCLGRTVVAAAGVCAECGAAGQFACTEGSPCDPPLRQYQSKCIACGAADQAVCGRPVMGPPCNKGLTAIGGQCKAATQDVDDQSLKGLKGSPDHSNGTLGCGRNGAQPCPGQPACGNNLFLIKDAGEIICSDKQPSAYIRHLKNGVMMQS